MSNRKSESIVDRIRAEIPEGKCVPKPKTKPYRIKGWGCRRNEPALVYFIPNRGNRDYRHEKGITETEFEKAYSRLCETGKFTRQWFNQALAKCAKEGSCNFTTIGGIFMLLDEASYDEPGVYKKK